MQMQPIGTADVISMQGSSWPQSIVAIFLDVDGKPVDLTGCTPRIFAGPSGAYNDGAVMDAFSGIAKFDVTPDMTASPGEYACSFSLPNTAVPDFKVDRLTLRVVLQQDGIYFAFLNQAPGSGDIQTQIDNIKTELSSKITEQDVQTAINGVQIGGVQLLLDSATLPTLHGWSESENTQAEDQGNGYYRLPLNTDVKEILQNKNVDTIHGATYTESFCFKTDSTTLGFSFDFFETNNTAEHIVQATIQNLGGGLYRAYATATVGDTSIRAIDIKDLVYTDGTYIDIAKPKFEIGTKPTDYCLADADQKAYTDGKVSAVSTTITQQQSQINQNASEIALRVEKSVYDTDMAGKANKATIISEINQSAEEISISAEKLNLNGYVTFNNLNIGGANLLTNTGDLVLDAGTSNWAYSIFKILGAPLTAGKTYTFSVESIASLAGTATQVNVTFFNSGHSKVFHYMKFDLSTSKQYQTWTCNADGVAEVLLYAGLQGGTAGNKIEYKHFKLEEGNIATAWGDPSVSGTTIISGDNIDTQNLKAQRIYNVSADHYAAIGDIVYYYYGVKQTGTGTAVYKNGSLLGGMVFDEAGPDDLGYNHSNMALIGKSGKTGILFNEGYLDGTLESANILALSRTGSTTNASLQIGDTGIHLDSQLGVQANGHDIGKYNVFTRTTGTFSVNAQTAYGGMYYGAYTLNWGHDFYTADNIKSYNVGLSWTNGVAYAMVTGYTATTVTIRVCNAVASSDLQCKCYIIVLYDI